MKPIQIAPHVWQLPLGFVNAYALSTPKNEWVLVDSGMAYNASSIKAATLEQFGKPPLCIVFTHGHLDHAGGASALKFDVAIYAHRLEMPYLDGEAKYPPQDPTVGGALAQASRLMPHTRYNFGEQLHVLPANGRLEELPGWTILETPGHSPGHVSLWHESTRTLIAGDALATADFDSVLGMLTHKPRQFARGGSPFNYDWEATKNSVQLLADLEPVIVAAGHGEPISGASVPAQMRDFARNFQAPAHGRYVEEAALVDESGVTSLPPKPVDSVGRNVLIGIVAALGVLLLLRRRSENKSGF